MSHRRPDEQLYSSSPRSLSPLGHTTSLRARHADQNRVLPGSASAKTHSLVEWYRRRATRRKLFLLECGIVRHAPFADCGRPLWHLMADQPWFETLMPPAECLRIRKESGRLTESLGADQPWSFLRINGHDAIQGIEQYADDADPDRLLLAEEYFRLAEWVAEADRFETPDDQRDALEIRYGAAYWLSNLIGVGADLWNILDYYLGDYPGMFYRWAGWRPLHTGHRAVAISLIEEIFGHPFLDVRFDPVWRTPEALAIATTMYEARDFTTAPILADALERAGCENRDMLVHFRSERIHVRGCWVIDRLLSKS